MSALPSRSDGEQALPRRVLIDLDAGEVTLDDGRATYPLDTAEAFGAVSHAWLRAGWDAKYVYSFTWLGRPMIQLPEDMVRMQEVIHSVGPDVIVETGVAHGGSLIFYASLCKAMGRGRVIGVDVEIRPHNREALDAHYLRPYLTLVEGSSTRPEVIDEVRLSVGAGEIVLVLLDSAHGRDHVLAELEAYAPLVTKGSYIVAMDGIMEELEGAPRTSPDWGWDNPREAVREFVTAHPEFKLEEPPFLFNEGSVVDRVTYWPGGFLKRVD
jgi:cephalosporin hydroxylase